MTRPGATAVAVATALASSLVQVWLLVGTDGERSLHLGTEAMVREELLAFLGEDEWPVEWTLVPVSAGRDAAELADALAAQERLGASLDAAHRALADALRERDTARAGLAAALSLAAGPPLRDEPWPPAGLAGLAAREAGL